MEENKKVGISGDDYPDSPVPMNHRVGWTQLTFVWFGAAMVAQLYLAGVTIGTGMGSLSNALEAILWGAAFLAIFVALNGIIGYATGCNAALSSTFAFGSKGVLIPSFHIADIGWYVVMIAIFANILHTMIPAIDYRVFCILFCYLFMTNGYIGFDRMVLLNKVAFPILFLVSMYGLYRVNVMEEGGILSLFDKTFDNNFTLAAAVTMVIGTWSAGASRAADYFRFAKSSKDALISSFLGFFVGFMLCIGCGVIWGAASESANIGVTLAAMGMLVPGAFMFFVQTWTTGEHSAYITSTSLPLAYETVTNKKIPRRSIILLVGVVGISIAGFDIENYYVPFISFLGAVIPVLGGIVITDFFIISRTKFHWTGEKNIYKIPVNDTLVQNHKFNMAVIPALILGLWASLGIKWGVAAINGLFITAIAYIIFSIILYKVKNK